MYESMNVDIQHTDIPPFSIRELINFPTHLINNCDAFLIPNFNIPGGINIPTFSMIHDVVFLDLPELTNRIGYHLRKFFLKRAIKKSVRIITVSEFSKERIAHFFKSEHKIDVVNNSIKENLTKWLPLKTLKTKKPYIIFVGNLKPHKGLKILLEAFRTARSAGFEKQLFIVGTNENMRTKIDLELKPDDDISFLGKIPDDQLFSYIYFADALIQPSLYEGFGIPPMEALFLGTTVILSDIQVFKEIYSTFENCHFFETGNSSDLQYKLLNVHLKKIDQKELLLLKYSYKYSANKLADIIMREYKNN